MEQSKLRNRGEKIAAEMCGDGSESTEVRDVSEDSGITKEYETGTDITHSLPS